MKTLPTADKMSVFIHVISVNSRPFHTKDQQCKPIFLSNRKAFLVGTCELLVLNLSRFPVANDGCNREPQVFKTKQKCSLYTFLTVLLFTMMSLIAGQCISYPPCQIPFPKQDKCDTARHRSPQDCAHLLRVCM